MLTLMMAMLLAAAEPAPPDAAPQPPAAAAPAPAKKKLPDPNEVICWNEKVTTSHLPQQVCATRLQKEQMERQGQDALRRNDRSIPTGLRPG